MKTEIEVKETKRRELAYMMGLLHGIGIAAFIFVIIFCI